MNATTTITYDRRRREYLLAGEIGEEIAAFPAGKEGKLAAQTAQLEIIAPAALALARRAVASYPVLVGRALRAAQIVAAGGVRDGLPHAWHVDSQSKEPTYTVSSGGYHAWHCTCPDWRRGWLGEPRSAPTLRPESSGKSSPASTFWPSCSTWTWPTPAPTPGPPPAQSAAAR